MRVYKTTDRLSLDLGELKVVISPLSYIQKQEVQSLMLEGQKNNDVTKMNDGILLALRYSLKEIQGLQDESGDYKLTLKDGMVAVECMDDLLNIPISGQLMKISGKLINGVPEDFEIEGVSFSKN